MVHTLFDEGLVRLGRLGHCSNGVDARARTPCGRSRPSAWPRAAASTADTIRAARARARRRAARLRLRPHRHLHAGVRHARALAGRRAQRADRQPRRPGGAMFPRPPPLPTTPAGKPGRGRGVRHRPPRAAASAAPPRSSASCRDAAWPRRSRRPARPGPGADHGRRQPGAVARPTARAWPRRSTRLDFMVSLDIYLNETTRHADVILPGRRRSSTATTTSRSRSCACATTPASRAGVRRAAPGHAARVADPAAPGGHRQGRWARAPTCWRSTTNSWPTTCAALAGEHAAAVLAGRWPDRAAPSACSTWRCAAGPTATGSAASPTA